MTRWVTRTNMSSLCTIYLVALLHSESHGLASYLHRNMHLVTSISPTMEVEEGGSVVMECKLENIPDRAEVAWVKIWSVSEVEYLSIYGTEDGVIDYEEEQFLSLMEEDPAGGWVWSLTVLTVTRQMTGFYQCQVGGTCPRVLRCIVFHLKILLIWDPIQNLFY